MKAATGAGLGLGEVDFLGEKFSEDDSNELRERSSFLCRHLFERLIFLWFEPKSDRLLRRAGLAVLDEPDLPSLFALGSIVNCGGNGCLYLRDGGREPLAMQVRWMESSRSSLRMLHTASNHRPYSKPQ
jgi:hypothetical protein